LQITKHILESQKVEETVTIFTLQRYINECKYNRHILSTKTVRVRIMLVGCKRRDGGRWVTETDLIESAAEAANGEGEQGVLLGQELGGAGIVSDESGDNTESTASLCDRGGFGKLGNEEEEEGHVEEEEEGHQSYVNSQGTEEEDEGDDEPRSQEDCDGIVELFRGLGVSSSDTVVWVEEGRVGQPETAVGGESSGAKSVASRELPHSSSELSKATDEAGHTDDSVGDGDAPSVDVVHRKDEGCASEREETERARVTDDPQLRGGVVDIGVTGEGAGSVSTLLIDRVLLECGGHLEI